MFQLLTVISRQDLFSRQVPALVVSLVVATFFYELGNFALECGAFLATWFVVDLVFDLAGRGLRSRTAELRGG